MKRKNVLALLFLILLVCIIPFPQLKATDAKTRIFISIDDGRIQKKDTNYTAAQTATSGQLFSVPLTIGQYYSTWYYVYRTYLLFDTSEIPNDANIIDAKLALYVYTNYSTIDFNVTIQNGQPTYPHNPLESEDYWKDHYSGNGGSRNTTEIMDLGYWNITLNSDGRNWLNLNGWTKLCLRSNRDINAVTPLTLGEYILVYGSEAGADYAPILYVTYEAPPTINSFSASETTIMQNEIFRVNAIASDLDDVADLVNATVELSHDIILKWDNASDVFSIYADPNKSCNLQLESQSTLLSNTSIKLSWKISLNTNFTEGSVDIIENNTVVFDVDGYNGTGSYDNLFTFQIYEEEPPGPGPDDEDEDEDWDKPDFVPTPEPFPNFFVLGVIIIIAGLAAVTIWTQIRKPKTKHSTKTVRKPTNVNLFPKKFERKPNKKKLRMPK